METFEDRVKRIQHDHNIDRDAAEYVAEAEVRMEERKKELANADPRD